jgi:hypothetical protein
MLPRDESFWLGQAIGAALRGTRSWLVPGPPPRPPRAAPPPPRYVRTLPGVTYDRRGDVLKASFNVTRHGVKRSIYLANATPTWGNEVRLSRMWQAARAVYRAGGDADAVRSAAKEASHVFD